MTGTSGKKIVLLLYGSAVLLCLGLLWYGKKSAAKTPGKDGIPTVEAMKTLRALPPEWARLTLVEGQGWVIYVPCHAPAATLRLEISEENPHVICEFCDTLTESRILGFASDGLGGTPAPGVDRFDINPGDGLVFETVDAQVAARYAGAPLKDYVLTWKAAEGDIRTFVPVDHAARFDTLKAEDEHLEGCLSE
jgi:hypothetical protein